MAFSKLPLIPSTFKHGDMFPLPEGQQIEFKQSLFDKKKLVHTACAFLNTCGGYYIIGVWDDSRIVGVLRNKVDETLLRVDQIIQESRIVNTTTGDFITHKEIVARPIPIEGSTNMLVIVEVQSLDPTYTYVVAKGECHYVRLGASNMRYGGTLRDTAANYLSEIDSLRGKLRLAQDESRATIRAIKEITISSHAELERILKEQRAALDLLHKSILDQKVDAEKRVLRERQAGILGLLCGVF